MASTQGRTSHQYLTAGALSTRQLLDCASYNTTPSRSPPNERNTIFSATDTHRNLPDSDAIARADRELEAMMRRNSEVGALPKDDSKASTGGEDADKGKYTAALKEKDLENYQGGDDRDDSAKANAKESDPEPGNLGKTRRWSWSYSEMKEDTQRAMLKRVD